ncbi:hypothetical protein ACQKP5_14250 [Pseudomonas vancouverensis]|uniref:hypothetical protein n=1 Tax=Pseudomonas vancouverensis TaxID=95300 RepID=UPI003D01C968
MDYSLYINSGIVLAVSQALSPAVRTDVLNSVAFATLAADEDFPGFGQSEQWFETYTDILTACGWSLIGHEMDLSPISKVQPHSAIAVIKKLADLHLRSGQTKVISSAMDKLAMVLREGKLPEYLRHHCLASDSERPWSRAMAGMVEENGYLTIVSVAFNDSVTTEQENLGAGRLTASPDRYLLRRSYAARFNQSQFEAYRQQTIEWLAQEQQPHYTEIGVISTQR